MRSKSLRGDRLPPSIMVCECIDGPYQGCVERISVNARFVRVAPIHTDADVRLPAELYFVADLGSGVKELVWWPAGSGSRSR